VDLASLSPEFGYKGMQDADSLQERVCAYACSRKSCFLHLCPMSLLRVSYSRRFGEGVTGRERATCNRVQGDPLLDGCRPAGSQTEASYWAGHSRSEVEQSCAYRNGKVVRYFGTSSIFETSSCLPCAAFTSSGTARKTSQYPHRKGSEMSEPAAGNVPC
jgi:hypothetical protein